MKQRDLSVRGLHLVNLTAVGASALAVTFLLSPGARAQATAAEGSFAVQTFTPAPGPRNYLSTRGARTDGEMAWSAGLMANYGYKPFVIISCESSTDCDDPGATGEEDVLVVENLATADLMGSFTPIPMLQAGLRIPVQYLKGQGLTDQGRPDPDELSAAGLGDPELELKGRFIGEPDDLLVLGAALFARAPLGDVMNDDSYMGDEGVVVGGRGIVDVQVGPIGAAVNLTGLYRGEGRVGTTTLGPEFRYGVAGGYQVSPVLRIMADIFGGTKFSSTNGTNTVEGDVGVHISPVGMPIVVTAGGGAGLLQGVGVPVVRALLGFTYIQEIKDRDGDGIIDDNDQCPTVAEDLDGFEDTDGCPDADNDGDLVPDEADKCPDAPEDPDGFEDTDGCAELDNDKDGIPDDRDACPNEPETKNNYKDEDGCPDEADRDEDGVPDERDKCPDAPEDTDGFEDTDGCPDPDNDQDGVPDNMDECIDEPETINGIEDEDGCPEEGAEPTPPEGAPAEGAPPEGAPAPAPEQ